MKSFKEWLDATPFGAGEIWSSFSNADSEFGEKGVRSKHFSNTLKNKPANFNADRLFLGKKRRNHLNNMSSADTIGDLYGTNNG